MGSVHPRPNRARRVVLVLLGLLYLLHNDFWNWGQPELVWGVPSGLLYHLGLCVLASLLFWLLIRVGWPKQLETDSRDESQ